MEPVVAGSHHDQGLGEQLLLDHNILVIHLSENVLETNRAFLLFVFFPQSHLSSIGENLWLKSFGEEKP